MASGTAGGIAPDAIPIGKYTPLNRQQIVGFWAAWFGWMLDGMDSVTYALVLGPALTEAYRPYLDCIRRRPADHPLRPRDPRRALARLNRGGRETPANHHPGRGSDDRANRATQGHQGVRPDAGAGRSHRTRCGPRS
jgi:hypothetical protein